jgi:hypothetical protein
MDGWANMGDNLFKMPGGEVRGVSLRSYDPRTEQWAVWWLDRGNPSGNLDPPIKGKFENGVGTFCADDTLRGKTIRVRVTWSHITASSRALGTGFLTRWWKDMGDELGHGVPADFLN